jgi:hypothetical protein
VRNDQTISRRVVIACFAAIPTFSASTVVADANIALIALGRKLNAASQALDQAGSSEWPYAATTGVSGAVSLTNSGNVTSSSNGQIIEGLNVNGSIFINHSSVSVRNCRAEQIFINYDSRVPGPTNITIEYCHVVGGSWNSGIVIHADSVTIRRCDVSGVENGIWLDASGCLIADNYLHNLTGSPDAHIDGLQIPAEASRVSNNMIRHNNFDLNTTNTNSCITMKDATNIDIDSNRLNGGTYSIYFEGNTTGCDVTNNLFAAHQFGFYGGTAAKQQTYRGNIFARR